MTPGKKPENVPFTFSPKSNTLMTRESMIESDFYQICPNCKKLVKENDIVCPYCEMSLSDYRECPSCKTQITVSDIVCPQCEKLLIYDEPKRVAAKRNIVLMPLGGLLLFSAIFVSYLNWKGITIPGPIGILFMLLWLVGFVFYGAYIGKGDKDFWFGK